MCSWTDACRTDLGADQRWAGRSHQNMRSLCSRTRLSGKPKCRSPECPAGLGAARPANRWRRPAQTPNKRHSLPPSGRHTRFHRKSAGSIRLLGCLWEIDRHQKARKSAFAYQSAADKILKGPRFGPEQTADIGDPDPWTRQRALTTPLKAFGFNRQPDIGLTLPDHIAAQGVDACMETQNFSAP